MMRGVACGTALVTCATLYGCGDSPSPSPSPSPTTSPSPHNSSTTVPTTNTNTTTGTPGTPAPADLVAKLNGFFSAWDPDDDSSPVGVLLSMGSPLNIPCNECDSDHVASDCRVSTALVNNKISVPGKEMLFQNGNIGGFVYWPEAVAPMVVCSYGMDGATDGRANHGCAGQIAVACGGDVEACPSACENTDPETGVEFLRDSEIITTDHCVADENLDRHCYWEGPSFYNGEGNDELRSMVKQRFANMDTAATEWNEVVVDSQAHDQSLSQDAAGLIAAFVVPVNAACDDACIRDLMAIRDETTQALSLVEPLPVVGFNVDGGDAPFEEFDASTATVIV